MPPVKYKGLSGVKVTHAVAGLAVAGLAVYWLHDQLTKMVK